MMQGHFGLRALSLPASVCVCTNHALFRKIAHHSLKLESPTLDRRCTTLWLKSLLFGGDQPWPSKSNLTWKSNFISFWACPHHNSSPIQEAPILDQRCNILWSRSLCFGGDWPRLFHALKSQYVYLSRQPRVFPRLTLLLLDYVKL